MELKLNALEKLHRNDIKKIFEIIYKDENPIFREKHIKNFGTTLSEIYNLEDLKEFKEYTEIVNEIDKYDPSLAKRLENYLLKEFNFIALLGLHVALLEKDKK